MHLSTISSKGQITIPIEVRHMFALTTGSRLEFIPYNNHIMIIPINKSLNDLRGILPKPVISVSCEKMNDIIKNKHDSN